MSKGPRGQRRPGRAITLLFSVALASGAACLVPTRGTCDRDACPDGQYCDVAGRVCVSAGGPVVSVDSPVGALDAGATTLRGRVHPLALASEAAYRLQGTGDWAPLTLDGEGRFEQPLPLPALDREDLLVEVRATSPAQAYRGQAIVTVDNVAPRIDFGVAEGEVGVPRELGVSFSEPVEPARADWLFLVQQEGALVDTVDAGTWGGDRRTFMVPGLPYNRPVRATVMAGGVHDDFGNTLAQDATTLFITQPNPPPAGPVAIVLDAGSAIDTFVAETSLDGVVNFAVKTTRGGAPETLHWFQFGADTGNLGQHAFAPSNDGFFAVFSGFSLTESVDPPILNRVGGIHRRDGTDTGYTRWRESGAFFTNVEPEQTAIVSVSPACGETGELGVGRLRRDGSTTWYRRSELSERALPVRAQIVAIRSRQNWQLIGQVGSTLEAVEMDARCDAPPTATFSGRLVLSNQLATPDARVSVALPPGGRSLYVYDAPGGGRIEACFTCVKQASGFACEPSVTRTAVGQDLRVTAGREGNEVIGARRGAGGRIDLVRRNLDDCNSTWDLIDFVAGSESATLFYPVRYANSPGVLYLQSGQLRVYR